MHMPELKSKEIQPPMDMCHRRAFIPCKMYSNWSKTVEGEERQRNGKRERERNAERLLSLLEELAFLKLKTATSSSSREIFLQPPTSHIGEKVQARAAVSEKLLHTELPGRAQKQGHSIHLSGNSNTLIRNPLAQQNQKPRLIRRLSPPSDHWGWVGHTPPHLE